MHFRRRGSVQAAVRCGVPGYALNTHEDHSMLDGQYHNSMIGIIKVTAYVLISFAQYRMIRSVVHGRMKAVVLSWFGWSLLMDISVVAQLQAQAWAWSWDLFSVLLSATGCTFIGIAGLWSGNYSRGKGDVLCLLAGLACMVVFFLFTNPWITTLLAIAADMLVAIPMLQGAFKTPADHRSEAWPIVLCAWTLTTASIMFNFSWLHLLWPLYLIGFSGLMTYLTFFRAGGGSITHKTDAADHAENYHAHT